MKDFVNGLLILVVGVCIGIVCDHKFVPGHDIRYVVPVSCTKTQESGHYVEFICDAGAKIRTAETESEK